MDANVTFIKYFQEIKKLNNVSEDTKHVEELYKKEMGKSKKREKSLLEIHQNKIAKKKRVI